MFYVGLFYRKPKTPGRHAFYIRVRNEPFRGAVAFNEKHARVAVRRYIKGNLSTALVCFDDGGNTPADASDRKYATSLARRLMIPGTGPGGYEVNYET